MLLFSIDPHTKWYQDGGFFSPKRDVTMQFLSQHIPLLSVKRTILNREHQVALSMCIFTLTFDQDFGAKKPQNTAVKFQVNSCKISSEQLAVYLACSVFV